MNPHLSNEIEIRLSLHYLDKIHATLLETGRSFNRVMVLLVLCSFFVVTLCLGAVSPENNISFSGLRLGITPWLLLFVAAWICALLCIYGVALCVHETNLRILIIEIYKSLNYTHKSLNDEWMAPYAMPTIVEAVVAPVHKSSSCVETLLNLVVSLVICALVYLGPIAAIVLAGYKMLQLFGRVWWVFTSFAILLFGVLGYLVISIKSDSKFRSFIRQPNNSFNRSGD